jgi:hypothetical protein
MPVVKQLENDFKRVIFLKSHELVKDGVTLVHSVGKYYHLAIADAEELIDKGIARLDTVHEKLLADEAKQREKAAAAVAEKPKKEEFVSPAPGVAETGDK